MAEQSFPFENIDTTESQFSEWATNFQETGVQGSPTGTELGITVTGSDLNLTIAAGQAFIRGHYYINTDSLVLPVTSAGTNTRIDIVVVELDPEANTIVTKIVSGEAVSADPVAPTLTQSATGIYQLPIATLTIPNSTVAITAGMLVDTRTFMGNRIGIWTTDTRPANPTAYQTLGYNTTIERHESWNGTAWVGFFDPITTAGDLVVGDETGQASRLGIGDDNQVFTVVDGAPAWTSVAEGGGYSQIATGSMTGNTLTISNIPSSYKFLKLVWRSWKLTSDVGFRMKINNATEGHGIGGNISVTYSNRTRSIRGLVVHNGATIGGNSADWYLASDITDPNNYDQYAEFDFPNYSDSSVKFMTFRGVSRVTETSYRLFANNAFYNGTEPITSISFYTDSSTFSNGTYYLYGVN